MSDYKEKLIIIDKPVFDEKIMKEYLKADTNNIIIKESIKEIFNIRIQTVIKSIKDQYFYICKGLNSDNEVRVVIVSLEKKAFHFGIFDFPKKRKILK